MVGFPSRTSTHNRQKDVIEEEDHNTSSTPPRNPPPSSTPRCTQMHYNWVVITSATLIRIRFALILRMRQRSVPRRMKRYSAEEHAPGLSPSRSSHTHFLPLPLLFQRYLEAPYTTPRPKTTSRVISRVLTDQAFEALISPVI